MTPKDNKTKKLPDKVDLTWQCTPQVDQGDIGSSSACALTSVLTSCSGSFDYTEFTHSIMKSKRQYSMGALVSPNVCTLCGEEYTYEKCKHLKAPDLSKDAETEKAPYPPYFYFSSDWRKAKK